MRTLFTWILLQLIVVCLTAQNSSDIYPKGWIDFSKNGKKTSTKTHLKARKQGSVT
jgi:hypothetical protein